MKIAVLKGYDHASITRNYIAYIYSDRLKANVAIAEREVDSTMRLKR